MVEEAGEKTSFSVLGGSLNQNLVQRPSSSSAFNESSGCCFVTFSFIVTGRLSRVNLQRKYHLNGGHWRTFGRRYKCVQRSRNFQFSKLDLSFLLARPYDNSDLDKAAKYFTGLGMIFTYVRVGSPIGVDVETVSILQAKALKIYSI